MPTTGLLAEPRAQYTRHQERCDVTIWEDGRQKSILWQSRPTVAQNSEYLLKVHYLGMLNIKSGSNYPTGMHYLFLTPGDLENDHFALFCRNCRCAPNLYLAQRYYYRVWYCSRSLRPQLT